MAVERACPWGVRRAALDSETLNTRLADTAQSYRTGTTHGRTSRVPGPCPQAEDREAERSSCFTAGKLRPQARKGQAEVCTRAMVQAGRSWCSWDSVRHSKALPRSGMLPGVSHGLVAVCVSSPWRRLPWARSSRRAGRAPCPPGAGEGRPPLHASQPAWPGVSPELDAAARLGRRPGGSAVPMAVAQHPQLHLPASKTQSESTSAPSRQINRAPPKLALRSGLCGCLCPRAAVTKCPKPGGGGAQSSRAGDPHCPGGLSLRSVALG